MLFSVEEENDSCRIYIVNDDLKQYSGELVIDLIDFNGTKLWNKKIIFIASENSSKIHFEIPKKDFLAFNLKQAVLSVSFPPLEQIYTRHYFFKPKDLQITKPNIQIKIINEVTIEISSDVLAKDVFLSSENEVFFEDNYFDLLPNEKRIIKFSKPVQNIKVKSLFDTLK